MKIHSTYKTVCSRFPISCCAVYKSMMYCAVSLRTQSHSFSGYEESKFYSIYFTPFSSVSIAIIEQLHAGIIFPPKFISPTGVKTSSCQKVNEIVDTYPFKINDGGNEQTCLFLLTQSRCLAILTKQITVQIQQYRHQKNINGRCYVVSIGNFKYIQYIKYIPNVFKVNNKYTRRA